MDRELEDQIDDIINKVTKDLKTRIARIVVRHQTKLLKEKAREFKTSTSVAPRKTSTTISSSGRGKTSKKDSKYSDSESDAYYSD